MDAEMLQKVETGDGFLAALDQSGGSTPKALALYGVAEDQYSGEAEMFDAMHAMRTRIMTSPSFDGDRILGAILFEMTMDRQVEGQDSADYLWGVKHVVPFLKIDKGLADDADGVQLMKPIGGLDELLERAVGKHVFGTKERSVIKLADARRDRRHRRPAVRGRRAGAGPRPGADPRARGRHQEPAEGRGRGAAEGGDPRTPRRRRRSRVMLKLSLPSVDGFYTELIDHPKVLHVVALSGGYSPRRGQCAPRPQPGDDRQLLAGADRGAHRPADRRRVRRRPGQGDRQRSSPPPRPDPRAVRARPSTFRARATHGGTRAES